MPSQRPLCTIVFGKGCKLRARWRMHLCRGKRKRAPTRRPKTEDGWDRMLHKLSAALQARNVGEQLRSPADQVKMRSVRLNSEAASQSWSKMTPVESWNRIRTTGHHLICLTYQCGG